jgi:hypothetical protein
MSDPKLRDDAGVPLEARFELSDASGPVAPRYAYRETIAVTASAAGVTVVRDRRDGSGEHHDERSLAPDVYETRARALLAGLPLGTTIDLVGDKAHNKGVSTNHVTIEIGGATARLDYLSSHLDEDDGDPSARAIVAALRAFAV